MAWDTQTWSLNLARLGVKPKEVSAWAEPFAQHLDDATFSRGRKELIEFMVQVLHESAMLRLVVENLNYSVYGLLMTFGKKRIPEDVAQRIGRSDTRPADQQAIANAVYGGEWGRINLGNTEQGDGWKFRGSGLLQTTGRDNFKYLKDQSGIDVIGNPELARTPGAPAVEFAILTWKRRIKPTLDLDNEREVRRAINGGTLGLEDCRTIRTTVSSVLG